MISFPRELSDELAELIAEKARVCGGGAFEIWEEICDQFGTQAQPQGEPVTDLIRLDRSYRNGLMAGFQFGIIGDEKGYAACIRRYNAGIQAAKAEQPAPVAVLPERLQQVL